jgi:hypothetical protein
MSTREHDDHDVDRDPHDQHEGEDEHRIQGTSSPALSPAASRQDSLDPNRAPHDNVGTSGVPRGSDASGVVPSPNPEGPQTKEAVRD